MSDDEELVFAKRAKTIHYGSLEDSERARQLDSGGPGSSADIGQIYTSSDYFDLENEVSKDKAALLEEFERKKKARQIHVSTDDAEVKRNLRALNEPICYFGEGPAERRIRLKELLAALGESAIPAKSSKDEEKKSSSQKLEQESTWYHEGPESLRIARIWLANYSLPRAKARLEAAAEQLNLPSATKAGRMVELQKRIQSLAPMCSQVGDVRPITNCCFNHDSTLLMTSSLSSLCKVWSVPDCNLVQTLRGHQFYVSAIAFRNGVATDSKGEVAMASGCYDGTVKLWSFDSEEAVADITGHMPHRVARLAFHPSGRFLGTACYDSSRWLWDLQQSSIRRVTSNQRQCLRHRWPQRLRARLRSPHQPLHHVAGGHLNSIYDLDFSPNGFHIVTGRQDNTYKNWNLYRRNPVYSISTWDSYA